MLIKDQWVDIHEQVFNILIAYYSYELSKRSSLTLTEGWLYPTVLLASRGEKLGEDLWIDQPMCYRLGRETFFLRTVALTNAVNDYTKYCYSWTVRDTYGRVTYVEVAWKKFRCEILSSPLFSSHPKLLTNLYPKPCLNNSWDNQSATTPIILRWVLCVLNLPRLLLLLHDVTAGVPKVVSTIERHPQPAPPPAGHTSSACVRTGRWSCVMPNCAHPRSW
jgi:hypothetical protein